MKLTQKEKKLLRRYLVWCYKTTKEEFPASDKMGPRVLAETDQRGIFSRVRGDIYCIAPPAVITDAEIDRVVDAIAESVKVVLG